MDRIDKIFIFIFVCVNLRNLLIINHCFELDVVLIDKNISRHRHAVAGRVRIGR